MKSLKMGSLLAMAMLFAACGDTVENQINQMGMEVVDKVGDLPKCTDDNEGEQAYVRGEASPRICIDGEWFSTKSGDASDFSCTTKELKDGSGLKIVCNGDSIGVVLNGSDGKSGKDGKAGEGCSMTEKTDTTMTVVCGDSTMVVRIGYDAGNDTLELDSERVAVSLDSLAGFSQKGPFLKGSTVYLYELSDGRTLKQTNGNFTSYITRDDGRYKFSARDLASQYAMIVVEGNYRNEVTGVPSESPIRLRALTDMRKRSDANINLLTTLEFDRVYYLVTREHKTVNQAKKQAQAEIFKIFDINIKDFKGAAEDLDVFGATDADAALLAISIMLQGDGSETDLSVLLTEIASDIETDGTWDNAAAKARLADWIVEADAAGRLGKFRKNVAGWKLGDTVPVFEKFVRNYYSTENQLGKCGDKDIPAGTVMNVKNPKSKYYAKEYSDTTNRARFICVNADSARWRIATEIEKDTAGYGHEFEEGNVTLGKVNREYVYVYQGDNWRHGTALDTAVGEGCMPKRDDNVVMGKDSVWYKCIGDSVMFFMQNEMVEAWQGAWRKASNLERDTNGLGHDGFSNGDIHRGVVDTSLVYVYEEGNWIAGTKKDERVGKGCVTNLEGQILPGLDNVLYICTIKYAEDTVRTWNKAPSITQDTAGWAAQGPWKDGDVRNGNESSHITYVYQDGAWRLGTALDSVLQQGCVTPGDTSVNRYMMFYYVCSDSAKWKVAPYIYGDTKDYREDCKKGVYSDGRIVPGKIIAGFKYVCDDGEFRSATSFEKLMDRGCVASTRNQIYKSEGTFYKCLADGFSPVKTKDRGVIKDRAGQEYQTVVIETQQWMAENLNYATDSSMCYDDKDANCNLFGRLYSLADADTVCPTGWHLPSKDEWATLFSVAGCSDFISKNRCDDVGYVLKSTGGWTASTSTLNGTDTYGFTVLPAGVSYYIKAVQNGKILIDRQDSREIRNYSKFWTYEAGVTQPYTSSIVFDRNYVVALVNDWDPGSYSSDGYSESRSRYRQSVRCIQD